MYLSLYLLLAIAVILVAYATGLALYRRYRHYEGELALSCPENDAPVTVALDPRYSLAGELAGVRDLKLKNCTRWPAMAGCDEACLDQVGGDPHALLVRVQIANWFEGKSCAICGRDLAHVEDQERSSAFLSPGGELIDAESVEAHRLDAIFATHRPVCWHCHYAVSFRRKHPELVVE
jgi:hypothetical protein